MLQDTNDRFLANIQRKGLYSVVPRIPGGEITPDKLIVIGQVAKKYGLYTKITGGQRVDLFGARVDQLPDIWEELIAAGFESGHAYAKSLRTVKSCVGSTWCRYGVGDSVGFAVRVENRYKGLRSPHKLKSAVSGCTRECAEAQSKDFGLIATEHGYNLYVCGNGGTKPRHAELLAADIDEDTAIQYIDRFLMYYIRTADKLQRTSVWIEKLDGGVDHLRDVIINDSLGLCAQLEADIQMLIDGYKCEWKDAVETPEKRDRFRHFGGPDKASTPLEMVHERGQTHPVTWPTESLKGRVHLPMAQRAWVKLVETRDVPDEGGTAVRYGDVQLAVFHFKSKDKWYVTQNLCPHKREMILARGLIGDVTGTPKVACPFHKKTFNLETGEGISDEELSIATFNAKVKDGWIYAELPEAGELSDAMRKQGCVEDCATAAE
jgi:nitrite reductase (NADH) large subunit